MFILSALGIAVGQLVAPWLWQPWQKNSRKPGDPWWYQCLRSISMTQVSTPRKFGVGCFLWFHFAYFCLQNSIKLLSCFFFLVSSESLLQFGSNLGLPGRVTDCCRWSAARHTSRDTWLAIVASGGILVLRSSSFFHTFGVQVPHVWPKGQVGRERTGLVL